MTDVALATLAGSAVRRARVQIPAWGVWWADVDTADPLDLAPGDRVDMRIGGVTCSGTVVSGGVYAGRGSYRVAGGAGGWGRTIAARSYRDDRGVQASSVIADAARDAGETIGATSSARLGPHYARPVAPASHVLGVVAPRAWYVDLAGVTQVGARASSLYDGTAPRTRVDPAGRVVEIATEDLAGLVPGVVVDGGDPATDVEYQLDDARLTARVYAGAQPLRRLAAWTRILDAIDPARRFRGVYEYRVVTQSGERLNLQPVRVSAGMPDLAGVPVRPGVAGARATVALGELVLVAFADADASRPQVIAHDAPDAPGWMPLLIEFGAAPTLGVARVTDPVVAGPFAGTITQGSARVKAAL